jgi:regulator of sigma E protease
MGPKILKKQGKETLYSLRCIPIGGFCSMEGEDEDSDDPKAFTNRPAWARAIVLFAGSIMNILFAVILLSIIIYSVGEPSTRVLSVTPSSPAARAGLEADDKIIAVNGIEVSSWNEITSNISKVSSEYPENAPGDTVGADIAPLPSVTLTVKKQGGTQKDITAQLYRDMESGDLKIGISPKMSHSPIVAAKSIGRGFVATWDMTKMMYEVLGDLFTGKAGLDQLTGPIGIVEAVDETAGYGFIYVVQLAALISLNLGIVNLLPLPALDGGRILFLVIRLFTGKRLSDRVEGIIHGIGFALLILLMVYITIIDVDRFIIK